MSIYNEYSTSLPPVCTVSRFHSAPGSPPSNITVSALSSSTILISWGPPQTPNGLISLYFLHIDYNNGSSEAVLTVAGSEEEWIVERLSPFQVVSVRMSAATEAGEGPLGDYVHAQTDEDGMFIIGFVQIT